MFAHNPTNESKSQASRSNGPAAPFFQPKLTVNTPGDAYEQEADAVADQVMRMRTGDAPVVQRMSVTPVSVQRACAACESKQKEEERVQRKETGGGDAGGKAAPSVVSDVLSSGGGQAMDGGTRQFMESRFGQDFSSVRIHTDSRAAESASAIQARAYTSGNNIVFGRGEYRPDSEGGKRLLAHELVHVGQQGGEVKRIVTDEQLWARAERSGQGAGRLGQRAERSGQAAGSGARAASAACPPANSTTAKQADIQPFIIANDDGSNPTTPTNMINVDRVWEKCCIHMNVMSPITIKKTDYRILDVNPSTASQEQIDMLSNCIDNKINVFYVETFRDENGVESKNHNGGGQTGYGGTSKPFCTLVEGAVSSVVAHEIGHALGHDQHVAGTIMEGSGAYNAANPEVVNSAICSTVRAWSPLKNISSEPTDCCMTIPQVIQ